MLVDSNGVPEKGTTVSSILRSSLVAPVIDQFRKAVKAKYSNRLSSVDAGKLIVFKNKNAFVEGKEGPLKSSSFLDSHGKTEKEEDMLVVVVPGDIFEAGIDYLLPAGDRKIKGRKTEWEISKLPQLSYDPSSTLFQLDPNYLEKTGIPPQKLVLYCRPTFHEQFKFLRERVVNNGVFGWILGPQGTGKSTTSLAFASTLDKNIWVITWIYLDIVNYPVCVRLEGDSKKSREIYVSIIDELFDILEEVDDS
jgi:hypothetical protein